MNNFYQKLTILVSLSALCGCMVGPDFEKPKSDLPEQFDNKADAKTLTEVGVAKKLSDSELAKWWDIFGDPMLSSLISRAFEQNLDLADAVSLIKQARATLGITQSGFFPSLKADAGFSEGGKINTSHPTYSVGTSASWEIDIFGGTRRSIEASVEDYRAALADKCAVKVAVAAEVAQNYFEYRAFQQELIITRSNLETQRKTFSITKQRKANGFVSELDVVRAAAEVDGTSAQIPQLESKMILARHALELLLALPSGALKAELETPRDFPEIESFIPAGVPAQLVRRRPDIMYAEHKLHAAIAKVGNAEADFYPKFFVTGEVAYKAPEIGKLVQNQYGTWSVGPSASWNLFQAGKTVFNVELQEAVSEAAGISWKSTVLTALKEVEDSLVSATKERKRITYLNRLVKNNKKAFELSSKLYAEGEIEFLDLLDSQRSMLSSEQNQVASRQLFISHIISLYKSLGGGWNPQDLKDTEPEKTRWLFFKDSFQPSEQQPSESSKS